MRSVLFVIGILLSAVTAALFVVAQPGSVMSLVLLLAFHGALVFHVIVAPWLLFIIREQVPSVLNVVIVVYLLAVFCVGGYGVYRIYFEEESELRETASVEGQPDAQVRVLSRQLFADAMRDREIDPDLVQRITDLVEQGVEVNARDERLEPGLWYAASAGNLEVVNALLAGGARVDDDVLYTSSPLLQASINGHTRVAKRLLSAGADPNVVDERGVNPLLAATRNGDLELVRALLDFGAVPKQEDDTGGTAVLSALQSQRNDILEILLQRGAPTVLPDWDFKLPMQIALENDDFDAVRLLEQHSEGFEIQTEQLPPVLFWVLEQCDVELFKRLLDMGADPNVRFEATGQTLFHRVLRNRTRNCGPEVKRNAFARLLLDANADINVTNAERESLLLVALYEDNEEIAQTLLARGAGVKGRNRLDRDALHLAARHGMNDIVRAAIEAGLDINRRSTGRNGTTPLEETVANRHASTATLLLKRGAQLPAEVSARQTLYRNAAANIETLRVVLDAYLDTERDSRSDRLMYMWVERGGNPRALELLREAGVTRGE